MSARRPSVARTLMSLTTLASVVALLTACVAFGWYDRSAFQAMLARRLIWQAQIVAANSASALVFDDPTAAQTTIGALRAVPNIVRAAIYRMDGSRFADYHRAGESAASGTLEVDDATRSADPHPLGDRLAIVRPVELDGGQVGTVTIEADLQELVIRQRDYLRLASIILFLSLCAALLMSWRSQRLISRPIADLANLASAVSRDRDYSHRAVVHDGPREVETLARTFNLMLAQIEERDLSLRRAQDELEDRVRVRTAQLESVNKELEAFSYSVSHDLRAPLRHIAGFAELLDEHARATLDDQGHKYLEKIMVAAGRMGKLIDDLLGFSRAGRTTLHTCPVDLDAAVVEACQEVSTGDTSGSIDWVIGPLPRVEADPALLQQALVNLIANAVKYSSTRERPRVEIGAAEAPAEEVVLFVRDNGVGFDMQYADKLFGVFQRLHSAAEFDGTGIGLANVQRIVARHGGRVWAESAVDQGATFFVALPRSKGST